VLAAENTEQITAFLARNPAFEVQSVTEVWGESLETPCPVSGPFLELSPARHGTDGFFAAVLVRKGPVPVVAPEPEADPKTETEET
jgi:16S rRNA (cytosine967-C5)-methyltransferase